MARQLRIQFEGALYHIISRGNERKMIFLDDADRIKYINTLHKTIKRFNWLCHVYCLMGNHYHLMIETPDANLALGMKYLNQVYCQFFNWKYHRVGHVLQDRYKSYIVQKEGYLLHRYGFRRSMSRKGDCYDNAVTESFFATLKLELFEGKPLMSREETARELQDYIEVFYIRQRRHSTLGQISPMDYEISRRVS